MVFEAVVNGKKAYVEASVRGLPEIRAAPEPTRSEARIGIVKRVGAHDRSIWAVEHHGLECRRSHLRRDQ
jgi:hypothetical protein